MPTGATHYENDTALGSGEDDKHTLKQPGAAQLSGSVTRQSTSYDLNVIWLDTDETEIETESVASGVAGGTQTTFDVPARSPRAAVQIVDAGAGTGAYDLVAHLR